MFLGAPRVRMLRVERRGEEEEEAISSSKDAREVLPWCRRFEEEMWNDFIQHERVREYQVAIWFKQTISLENPARGR